VFFLTKWSDGLSHFATFNVADIAIVMGVVLLMLVELKDNK
jgi:lipoprotein signal peptidase